ncbi:MAG TPA: hypothetical protein VGW40_03870 [Allosphingosinicella sp.]|nr:hypothetical protein [Allosphingosinicella sp.]
MSLDEKIAFITRLIRSIGSIVGLAVPTAILIRLGRLPDYVSDTALILLPSVTIAVIIAIFVLGEQIGKLASGRIAAALIACAMAGATCTAVYSLTAYNLVIGRNIVNEAGTIQSLRDIKPLTPTDRIRAIIHPYRDDYHVALMRSPYAGELRRLMRDNNQSAVGLILVTMLLAQLLLVVAIVGGAWWLAERQAAALEAAAARESRKRKRTQDRRARRD